MARTIFLYYVIYLYIVTILGGVLIIVHNLFINIYEKYYFIMRGHGRCVYSIV